MISKVKSLPENAFFSIPSRTLNPCSNSNFLISLEVINGDSLESKAKFAVLAFKVVTGSWFTNFSSEIKLYPSLFSKNKNGELFSL